MTVVDGLWVELIGVLILRRPISPTVFTNPLQDDKNLSPAARSSIVASLFNGSLNNNMSLQELLITSYELISNAYSTPTNYRSLSSHPSSELMMHTHWIIWAQGVLLRVDAIECALSVMPQLDNFMKQFANNDVMTLSAESTHAHQVCALHNIQTKT